MIPRVGCLLLLALAGCASSGTPRPAPLRSPLELRQVQSRTYPQCDARSLMRATLSTFQDQGFAVRSTDAELGLITAARGEVVKSPQGGLKKFLRAYAAVATYGLALLALPGDRVVSEVSATARIEEVGAGEARLRLSFQLRVADSNGKVRQLVEVTDPGTFQGFLAQVDKNLFLQREKL